MNSVKILRRLARADAVFFILPFIMLNLAAGTVAQRFMGLYAAQEKFFGSFLFWLGPLPLPGGYLMTSALAVLLALKFFLESEWSYRRAGINLAHLGALVLLGGGLVSSLSAREGYMIIPEGEASPYVFDYIRRDLHIFENDRLMAAIPFENSGAMPMLGAPEGIEVVGACANCGIEKRDEGQKNLRGMARFMRLEKKPPEKEPEENISGVTLKILGFGPKQDGFYIAFEGMPKPIELKKNGRDYKIMFGREQRMLPFSLKLKEFIKETYPGTDKAKSYSSDLDIIEAGAEWPARVEMNAPLRYKGYTFYQSSFIETPEKVATVLATVENKGRIFPYLGTVILASGLLLHLLMALRERRG